MGDYKNELEKLLNLKRSLNIYQQYGQDKPLIKMYEDDYFYARNFDKAMDDKFDKTVAQYKEILPIYSKLSKEENSLKDDIAKKFDVKKDRLVNSLEKETYFLTYIDGVLVDSTETKVKKPVLTDKKDLKILDKINELQFKNDMNSKKIEKLLAKNPNVSNYIKANSAFEKYHKYLLAMNSLPKQKEYDAIKRAYEDKISTLNDISYEYAKGLKAKKYQIALAVLFIKNFNELSHSEIGAVAQFAKDTKADFSDKNYAKHLEGLLQKIEVASLLHEEWRKGRVNYETGKYEPRWKQVKDASYKCPNKQFAKTENGVHYIDIANLPFNDLSFDWQLENFEAAEIATELSKRNYKLEEVGKVGKEIHNEWLKRNEYAKSTELGKTFAELCTEERLKDIVQYFISLETVNKDTLISAKLNRKNFDKHFSV